MEENADTLQKLKQQGWYLTEDGLKKILNAEKPGSDFKKIIAAALNWDFREIAGGALPSKREDTIPGRIVLQVQKIRNISAPKSNEESKAAPRLLQVDLSDGQLILQGLELEPIPTLNLNVAPGTKIFLRSDRLQLMQGFAVLRATDVQVLGGRVDNLAEKWELARTMLKYARGGRRISGTSGPPPWIAFGKKLEINNSVDTRNFKSLQAALEKEKNGNNGNEEFNAMRTEAIAEAAKAGAKKIFGGGNQQIPDYNVKKILEKGYSEKDAKQALRSTNNNLERALYNLKRRDEHKRNDDQISNIEMAPANAKANRGGAPSSRETNAKRGSVNAKEEAAATKPAANVSLFDFLTEKLPTNPEANTAKTENTKTTALPTNNSVASNPKFSKSKSDVAKPNKSQNKLPNASSTRPKFENNISSSFTATRAVGETRSSTQHERDSFKASERQSNNRGSSTGGRVSNGRGRRGSKVSRDDENSRVTYREKRSDCRESEKRERNSNINNNDHRNRSSDERKNVTNSQNENDKNQQQKTIAADNAYENRRPQDTQRKKRDDKTKHSSSYKYTSNSNRRQNNSDVPSNGHNSTIVNTKSSIPSEKDMNKLVESTARMKINKTQENTRGRKQQQRQQNQRQPQPPQSHQQQPSEQQPVSGMVAQQYHQAPQLNQQMILNQTQANYSQQLANGFTYDPSKIIGFQNKETNEFAMTLLKSQGLAPTTASPAVQPTVAPPIATTGHFIPSSSTQMQIPSQHTQSPFGKPAAFVLPTVQNAPPPQISPGGPSYTGSIQPCENWAWKIGDLCMAKYWDDGIYYEAEITGISDKTCVVFFRGYGNHEEVLQTDCVPITDANHRPINQFNVNEQRHHMLAPVVVPNVLHGNVAQNRGIPNRYRGERQVYVPPPKREN